MDNKSLSHTRLKCQYHIVFIPKYRKKVLYGRLKVDVKEIICTLCKYKRVDITRLCHEENARSLVIHGLEHVFLKIIIYLPFTALFLS